MLAMYKISIEENNNGKIVIDNFEEYFEIDYSYWSKGDYEEHWADSHSRLREGKTTVFLTSVSAPESANFLRGWVAYPVKEEVAFREQVFFQDQLKERFSLSLPHDMADMYSDTTEDGFKISEWRTTI